LKTFAFSGYPIGMTVHWVKAFTLSGRQPASNIPLCCAAQAETGLPLRRPAHSLRLIFSSAGKLMLNYSVTPVFLALAYINYVQAPPMCTVPGDWGFLSSMWLMYLLMGLAHCPPWLALAARLGGALPPPGGRAADHPESRE
jgi:hypothetical protein